MCPGPRLGTLLGDSQPLLGRPERSKIGLGTTPGRSGAVRSTSRRVPETALSVQHRPGSKFPPFRRILRQFSLDFHTTFALCVLLLLFLAAGHDRQTKRKKKKKCRFRGRLACGRSSLPTRLSRSIPKHASQRFTRSIKQSPPSAKYTCGYVRVFVCFMFWGTKVFA